MSDRYLHDPKFHRLVDMIRDQVIHKIFTIEELQEALNKAKEFSVQDRLTDIRREFLEELK